MTAILIKPIHRTSASDRKSEDLSNKELKEILETKEHLIKQIKIW